MAKKNDSRSDSGGSEAPSIPSGAGLDARKVLLARIAGDVASSIMVAPSKSATSAGAIAEIAVDVAEEILRRTGL
jgi:hypothetical protein